MVQNLGKAEASALIERAKQVSLLHDFVVSLLSMTLSRSIHVAANGTTSFFLVAE